GAASVRLTEIDRRLSDINAEKTGLRGRLEAILAQGEKDSYWVGINAVLNSGIAGIRGTLRHLLTIKKEDRLAVEEALGRFMDAVVCDSGERAGEAIEYLRHLGKGRCRFILLDKALPASTEGETWSVPNAARIRAKIACPQEYERALDRLLGGVYSSGGSVLGDFWVSGGVETVTSNEPYWEEEGDLKEKIRVLEEEAAGLSAEREGVAGRLASSSALASELETKINSMNMDLHRAQVEAENADGEAKVNAQNTEITSSELSKAEGTLGETTARLAALNARLEEARAASERKKADMSALAARKDELHAAHSKVNEDIGSRKAHLDNHQSNLEKLKDEVVRNEAQLAARYAEREHNAALKLELSGRLAQLTADTEECNKRLLEIMNELAEKEVLQTQLSGELHSLRNDCGRLNVNLNDSKVLSSEG
ncbi:MAG TPA: hypothetical protein PL037_09085, partial [Elusimicrobiales bacterium]|nr:hypothetical protein [Elusimicrobiales bacterium]